MAIELTRNFCIIAHIDHGKTTLSDRLLERTGTIQEREKQDQLLDSMDLERERGITIKAHPVMMRYTSKLGETYRLNLLDTPGHVDFAYDVSRSLAACEGALLVVDAAQGVEAQTVANSYLAIESGLELIPCLNKIDLPGAEPERVAGEVSELIGGPPEAILRISGKTGAGVSEVLEHLIGRVPAPSGDPKGPPRALIFDSEFDQYRGVIAYIRVVDGAFRKRAAIRAMAAGTQAEIDDIGVFSPQMMPTDQLAAGEVGYLTTGLKDVTQLRVGDTLTTRARAGGSGARAGRADATEALPGYREVKPMVFCGLFPIDSDDYPDLRDALEKLTLNDAALSWEPETSDALGFGFRCGFLGLLHMDIVRERLEREYDLELLATMPSVDYELNGLRPSDLVKLDVLLAGDPVDALSMVVHRDKAYEIGRSLTEKLRKRIPRQQYDVPIQAAIGSHIIARETVKAYRKDVIAKCYGGDITRKKKLLTRQKEGKRRMKQVGRVEVPQEAFLAVLELGEEG